MSALHSRTSCFGAEKRNPKDEQTSRTGGIGPKPNAFEKMEFGGGLKLHWNPLFGEVSNQHGNPKVVEKQDPAELGSELAKELTILGVAAENNGGQRRGGARNHANRQSFSLTIGQIGNLRAATLHAFHIGLPFTRMITIHWESAGVPIDKMARATGHFLDLLTKAIDRQGSRTAWVWVHEGGERKGGHCHMLVHVPASIVTKVTKLQMRWLRRVTRRPYRAKVILSKPIGGRVGIHTTNPPLHFANVAAALAYLLKGASPDAAKEFQLDRLEPGGLVIGKRCGTSQNVGAKARRDAGVGG